MALGRASNQPLPPSTASLCLSHPSSPGAYMGGCREFVCPGRPPHHGLIAPQPGCCGTSNTTSSSSKHWRRQCGEICPSHSPPAPSPRWAPGTGQGGGAESWEATGVPVGSCLPGQGSTKGEHLAQLARALQTALKTSDPVSS